MKLFTNVFLGGMLLFLLGTVNISAQKNIAQLNDKPHFNEAYSNIYTVNLLAQWPNRSYNHIDKIVKEGPTTRWLKPGEKSMPYSVENPIGGKFIFKEDLSPKVLSGFIRTGDIRAQGYFS
ncbi:hypothetical protein [Flavicella sediminum]|uniref:hypothetical protein n=1 Tax=Flavicella sediminum TaxID=2585141 RepID=UPI0011206260|nr:hypothetical protein [Flavicella sediminum]